MRRPITFLTRLPIGVALVAVMALLPAQAHAAPGDISTFAGTGVAGFSGDGGLATSAQLNQPTGAAFGPNGELYIADSAGNRVRKVVSGTITTVAGTGSSTSSGDGGPATSAGLDLPTDVAVDSQGRLYIVEYGGHRVRRISASGTISTVAGTGSAGSGGDGGAATAARLDTPAGITIAAGDILLIADYGNNRVRKVANGTITTVAGTGTAGSSGDGGAATLARLYLPADVETDTRGNVFIAEDGNHRVRKVSAGGTISTIAGTGAASSSGDGGPATSAALNRPVGVDVDSAGVVYVAEFGGHRVRRIGAGGTITTVAGTGTAGYSGDGGPATSARLSAPVRATLASGGDFYIPELGSNRVRRVEGLGAPDAPAPAGSTPDSPANDNAPRIAGSAEPGTTVRLYTNSTCTSALAASGSSSDFAAPGLAVSVPDDSSTTFYATATTSDGATSGCSAASVTYVEDSTAPAAPSIDSAPAATSSSGTPKWAFSAEAGASFECRLESDGVVVTDWQACTSPTSYDLSSAPDGGYSFLVRATDRAGNTGTGAQSTFQLARPTKGKGDAGTTDPPPDGGEPEPEVPTPFKPEIDPATILPGRSIEVRQNGFAPVRVGCPEYGDGYCRGRVKLLLLGGKAGRAGKDEVTVARRGGSKTRSKRKSRRRKPMVLGSRSFRIRSGESAPVRVRVSRRGRRAMIRRKRKRCRISVAMRAADGSIIKTTRTFTLRERRGNGRGSRR